MQDVSVAVAEEDQSIALVDKGFAKKVNPTITKLGVGRVERGKPQNGQTAGSGESASSPL